MNDNRVCNNCENQKLETNPNYPSMEWQHKGSYTIIPQALHCPKCRQIYDDSWHNEPIALTDKGVELISIMAIQKQQP
jgi:hypothetical protein